VDVNEFVTTHKLNFLEAHTFLLVSHIFKHFIFYHTQGREISSCFLEQQSRQTNR